MLFTISAVLTISIILGGCSQVLYAPNGQNVPLFTEKNEARIVISGIGGNQSDGFEIQTAYAISPKIAIMCNSLFLKTYDPNRVDEDGFPLRNGKINMGEFGVGYFKPLKNDKWVFEVYGGLGFGNLESRDSLFGLSTANFLRVFAQPSIGSKGKHVEFAFSSRVGILNYSNSQHESTGATTWVLDKTKTYILFEPAFTIRAGWKNIKFQSQAILSLNATQIYNLEEFPQEYFCFNIGVFVALRQKKG